MRDRDFRRSTHGHISISNIPGCAPNKITKNGINIFPFQTICDLKLIYKPPKYTVPRVLSSSSNSTNKDENSATISLSGLLSLL